MADVFTNTSDDFYCEGGPDFTLTQYRIDPGGTTLVEGGVGFTKFNTTDNKSFSTPIVFSAGGTGKQMKYVVKEGKHLSVGLEGPLSAAKTAANPDALIQSINYNVAVSRIGTTPLGSDLISYSNNNTIVLDKANICMNTTMGCVTVGKSEQIFGHENYKTLGYAGAGASHATPNWGVVYETNDMMGMKMKLGAQLLSTDYQVPASLVSDNTVLADQPVLQAAVKYDIYNFGGFMNGSITGSYFTCSPKNTLASSAATSPTSTQKTQNCADLGLKLDFGGLEIAGGISEGQNIGMNNLNQGSKLSDKKIRSTFVKISSTAAHDSDVPDVPDEANEMEANAADQSWLSWASSPLYAMKKIGFSVDYGTTTNNESTVSTTAGKNTSMGGEIAIPALHGKFESLIKYRQWKTESGNGAITAKVEEIGIGGRCSF